MRRIEKPFGLYVVTLVDFAAFGVLQFFKTIADARNAAEETSFPTIFIALFLSIFTAAAAVWAFLGDNSGRYALLFFITLNVLWLVGNLSVLILNEGLESKSNIYILIAAGKTVWAFGANWWYLTTGEIVEYFNRQSKLK
ncbi:MAG TPA: hypothetical protein VF599_07335 [Pyrinomonadaceae bacterium]|jgi:hypothetical protein